jgi:hypothetical protein
MEASGKPRFFARFGTGFGARFGAPLGAKLGAQFAARLGAFSHGKFDGKPGRPCSSKLKRAVRRLMKNSWYTPC